MFAAPTAVSPKMVTRVHIMASVIEMSAISRPVPIAIKIAIVWVVKIIVRTACVNLGTALDRFVRRAAADS